MKRLKIQQLNYGDLDYLNSFSFELQDLKSGKTICKDSIDDIGQGIEKATEQIQNILRRKGQLQ